MELESVIHFMNMASHPFHSVPWEFPLGPYKRRFIYRTPSFKRMKEDLYDITALREAVLHHIGRHDRDVEEAELVIHGSEPSLFESAPY